MSNVVQLFKLKKIGDHSSAYPNATVTIAVADILASYVQLDRTVKELSKHFGAVDHAIDGLGDLETKNLLAQSMKQTSEALTTAMLELSQAIGKLPRPQIGAIAD